MATTKLTNYQAGPRGINMRGGTTVWIEPGETAEIDKAQVEGDMPDLGKKPDQDAEQAQADRVAALTVENDHLRAEIADLTAKLASLDGDGDGKPGGSQAQTPPALTGKSKGELLDIAKAEGVDATDEMTIPQITDAIKAKRAA